MYIWHGFVGSIHLDSDNFKSAAKSKTHRFGEIEVNAIREENAPRRKTKQNCNYPTWTLFQLAAFHVQPCFFVSSAPKLSNKLDNKLQSAGGLETRNATNISFIIESTLTFLTLNFNLDSAPETFSGIVYNNFANWVRVNSMSTNKNWLRSPASSAICHRSVTTLRLSFVPRSVGRGLRGPPSAHRIIQKHAENENTRQSTAGMSISLHFFFHLYPEIVACYDKQYTHFRVSFSFSI